MENSFIENVNKIAENLPSIVKSNELFNPEITKTLESLMQFDFKELIEDLQKGNYLGNRKIDINLALNNLSSETLPTYKQADIILVDGTKLEIPFDNGSGGILELTSHADIKQYITTHALWTANVVNTEIVVQEEYANNPALIRLRDADGKSSNVERVELYVYTGTVADTKPSYFWAKTTSTLETIANRVGDIIALGNDINKIVSLSQRIDELIELQNALANILSVYSKLTEIEINATNIDAIQLNATNILKISTLYSNITALIDIHTNLNAILDAQNQAQLATQGATTATQKADIATTQAGISTTKASEASASATLATQKANAILNLTVQATTLIAGSMATVSYNSADGKMTFGIPKGDKGDRGEAFKVNAIGTFAGRTAYDDQPKDFSYFASDLSLIYFKNSNTTGDWTSGIPFGKGDKGDIGDTGNGIASIARISGDGSSGSLDTYRVTMTDGTNYDFNVYNGADSDVSMADVTSIANALSTRISANETAIQNHVGDTNNPHNVTKAQIGLDKVNNTSDSEKNVLSATKLTTSRKINGVDFDGTGDITIQDNTKATIESVAYLIKPFNRLRLPLFTKASPTSITIPAGTQIIVGTTYIKTTATVTLDLNSNLVGSTKTAGTDYFVYAKVDGTFYISASDSITSDRLIGGFHYGLVGEAESASGNKTTADMVKIRGINEYSLWDLKYRANNQTNRGMLKIGGAWYDIYLMHSDYGIDKYSKAGAWIGGGSASYGRLIPKIPLEFGGDGSVNYGKFTWFQACEIAKASGKRMISYEEFCTIAYGVLEKVSSSTNGYETTAGKIEHYPNLTSKFGIEQATGTEWIWGSNLMNGYGTTDWAWKDNADGRGQIYSTSNSPTAVVLGGSRDYGTNAGSRASHLSRCVWYSHWDLGCRFACDHLELV